MACVDDQSAAWLGLIWQVEAVFSDQWYPPGGPNQNLPNNNKQGRTDMEERLAYRDMIRRANDQDLRQRLRTLAGIPPTPLGLIAVGDSLTAGDNSADATGYRGHLIELLDRLDRTAMIDHSAAVDGARLSDIAPLVPGVLAANPAPIVLLLVGTNDASAQSQGLAPDWSTFPTRYAALVDEILAAGRQVACGRIPLPDPGSPLLVGRSAAVIANCQQVNTWVDQVVAARTGAVVAAGMSVLPASWLLDRGWHPGDTGYLRMAKIWLDAIGEWL